MTTRAPGAIQLRARSIGGLRSNGADGGAHEDKECEEAPQGQRAAWYGMRGRLSTLLKSRFSLNHKEHKNINHKGHEEHKEEKLNGSPL